jgi:hypothetical protein
VNERQALLTIYANLGFATGTGEARAEFYSTLYGDHEGESPIRVDPPGGEETLAPLVRQAVDTLVARPEKAVLPVEIAEALVALAADYTVDDRKDFVEDPSLRNLARLLVEDQPDPDDELVSELLAVVFDVGRGSKAEAYEALRPHWRGLGSRSDPQGSELQPIGSAATTTIELLGEATRARVADLVTGGLGPDPGVATKLKAVAETVFSQPGVRCEARLVPVEIDGHGEYAVHIRTDVTFDRTALPTRYTDVDAFVHDLFDPETWPDRHPFWCAMTPLPGGAPTSGDQATAAAAQRLEDAIGAALAVGPASGPGPVLGGIVWFREEVEQCPGGSFPNTILAFADSVADDGLRFLEYRLCAQFSKSLALDDGTIQVREHGDQVTVVISKTVYFTESKQTTQGEVLAEWACVSGWAEQTRQFVLA